LGGYLSDKADVVATGLAFDAVLFECPLSLDAGLFGCLLSGETVLF
jgi:hypothetical protein